MKIKRLQMTSFRGIGNLALEFPPDEPIVFVGINGIGKSSILDCLAILLYSVIKLIVFPPNNSIDLNNRRQEVGELLVFNSQERDSKTRSQQIYNEVTMNLSNLDVITWSFTIRDGKLDSDDQNLKLVIESLRYYIENPNFNLPLAVYYPVNRSVNNISLEIHNRNYLAQVEAYEGAINGVNIEFSNFFRWFRTLEDLESEEMRDNPAHRDIRIEAVRQAIYSLIPEFSKLRVRRSPLRMTVEKQGQELIVDQLSDGEKCLLAMVGDIARRLAIANPGLPDPLQGEGVVLIDEIELHLHPKWQREIIPALTRTFPNCQFIVTTHSPQVLSQVKPEGIYILEATSEGVVARKPESSYGRDSNRILEDLMGVPERPQEIKDRLRNLFRLIDDGKLIEARKLQKQLEDEIGDDEPDFASADMLIRRKEILSR